MIWGVGLCSCKGLDLPLCLADANLFEILQLWYYHLNPLSQG